MGFFPSHNPYSPVLSPLLTQFPPVQIGDPAVGKSAVTQMFHSGGQRFPKVYNMTCGVDFCAKSVGLPGTEEAVELHLFDSAGQDVFAEMMPKYWEGAKGVVLVYDVTRAHTLEACGHWYGRLVEALGVAGVPGVLVANKTDLRERTVVTRQQGQQMAASMNMEYFEVSALEGAAVEEPFVAIAKHLHGGGMEG
jgi:transport family protein 27